MQITAHLKFWLRMKLILTLIVAATLQVSANGYAQGITLSAKDEKLDKVFKIITDQTGYLFFYNNSQLEAAKKITIDAKNESIDQVLAKCFKDQPLTYSIINKTVVVESKTKPADVPALFTPIEVRGRVTNENGEAVAGATVQVKGSKNAATTDANGEFILPNVNPSDILVISGAEMEAVETRVGNRTFISLKVNVKVDELDQVVMMAYGQTTRRLNTGNISKVTAQVIGKQPVSNPLAAMQGRVPGLVITQLNGYANGMFSIQLRGQNSILQGSQPYFIIDGIPFAPQNEGLGITTSASSGTSPFYSINPADIESIEVLKDADATAIYGSRGANGVILVTTKKGKAGKTKITANMYSGWGEVTRTMEMLKTPEYVQMRKEAFANDGLPITGTNAADILIWDSTRYTDVKDLFLAGASFNSNADLSISGGNSNINFIISSSYNTQKSVLPVDLPNRRYSLHTSLAYGSTDKKLDISVTSGYSYTNIRQPGLDPTAFINRSPNMKLYDSLGNLNWQEGGVTFRSIGISEYSNPLASLNTLHDGDMESINSSLSIKYQLLTSVSIKTNLGYSAISLDQTTIYPSTSRDPFDNAQTPSAEFGNSSQKNWIIEPQIEFKKQFSFGRINILLGSSWQSKSGKTIFLRGSNYTSDLLLNSISGAGDITTTNGNNQYRYTGTFSRINYNWKDKFILNLTARRDGSSRFGPNKRFDQFGAIGGAWIFAAEKSGNKRLAWLSFGKIRMSYGSAGNDAIGDYKYLDTWNTSPSTYQGVPGLTPSALFNPDLVWERNRKFDSEIDFGFFHDRIMASICYFKSRSSNQLVQYNLPIQTGFSFINMNRDALVQNSGYEITLETKNIILKNFRWVTNFNLTTSRNKLLKFPGLETSNYANQLIIGQPVSVTRQYSFLGINPTTGTYDFLDVDGNGIYNTADRIVKKNRLPAYYGGMENHFTYKSFEIAVMLQFTKQEGLNYLNTISTYPPGIRFRNQPALVLKRWQKPGDITDIAKFTTKSTGTDILVLSDAVYSDASFIRCKNISFSYNLNPILIKKIGLGGLSIYMHAQNLFVITRYKGSDPENQNMYKMPPLRNIVFGVQATF